MTASKIFLYSGLSFIFGIFLSSFLKFSQLVMLGVLIFGLTIISVLWRYKKLVIFGFCLLFLVLGIWRYQIAEFRITKSELRSYNNQQKVSTIIGIVSAEPDLREKNTKLIIKTQSLNGKEVNEKILVTTQKYPQYQYGDKLKIIGELKAPQEFGDFNYPDYLAKDGIYSVMDFPKIELLNREDYESFISGVYAKILKLKNKLGESIYQNLSPPQSSILGAMILGDKRRLSEDLKEKLNITGVRHITAISGLHITVLTVILMNFLIGLGFWRQQAFYFTIILISVFIVMTGLQPSAIRAGIMGGLFLLAQYLGRMGNSSRFIFFVGAVMLAQNPLLLKLDIGFQLSFLAMMGIIYLLPIFQDFLKFIPWKEPKSILAMTLSAYLFTLPLLIYNFGYISFVAPLTNLLIVPTLYWIMIFGFIFALSGMTLPILGWILSFPVWLLLTYLIKVIDFFSQLPLASLSFQSVHWVWLGFSYLILGLITWRLHEKQKLKFLEY